MFSIYYNSDYSGYKMQDRANAAIIRQRLKPYNILPDFMYYSVNLGVYFVTFIPIIIK